MREGVGGGVGTRSLAILALVLTLAACDRTEPYTRQGDWHPLGANAANLSAMVADPRDLYQGRGAVSSAGDLAAAAVARLRADAVKRLPASSISDVHATDTGPQAAPGNEATPSAPVAAPTMAATP
ncbi:MAG: hypothetical protein ABI224_05190 [Acetobacteraceae bacterium]